jgi:amidase
VTVPAGHVQGLPWGLSILGPAWSDAKLVRYALAFERESRVRRAPRLPSTVDFAAT